MARKAAAQPSPEADPLDGVDCETYRHHLREHTPAEAARLEEAIEAEGCRDPLVVGVLDGKRHLVNGYHRLDLCRKHGLPFRVVEQAFADENALLAWMEKNADVGRNRTRTDANYRVGSRYLREKQTHGGQKATSNGEGKSVPLDRTADRIAREEGCSDRHVKNCARLAAKIDDAVEAGLGFLKEPILSERMKCNAKLIDELIHLGAGGCREQIEALLAAATDGKAVPAGAIRQALGLAAVNRPTPLAVAANALDAVVGMAEKLNGRDLSMLIGSIETKLGRLRGMLKRTEPVNEHSA